VLVPPQQPDWGTLILTSTRSGDSSTDFIVGAEFTVPDANVSGVLQGSITYPRRSGKAFLNQTDQLANPVTITVRPRGERSAWATGSVFRVMVGVTLVLAFALAGCVGAVLVSRIRAAGFPGAVRTLSAVITMPTVGLIAAPFAFNVQFFSLASPRADFGLGASAPAPLLAWWVLPLVLTLTAALSVSIPWVKRV